jgi:hypothetical protein
MVRWIVVMQRGGTRRAVATVSRDRECLEAELAPEQSTWRCERVEPPASSGRTHTRVEVSVWFEF